MKHPRSETSESPICVFLSSTLSVSQSTSDTREILRFYVSFNNEKQRGRPSLMCGMITDYIKMGTYPVFRREGKGHFFIINYTSGSFSELIYIILLFFKKKVFFPFIYFGRCECGGQTQLMGFPRRPQGSNSGHKARQQVPL